MIEASCGFKLARRHETAQIKGSNTTTARVRLRIVQPVAARQQLHVNVGAVLTRAGLSIQGDRPSHFRCSLCPEAAMQTLSAHIVHLRRHRHELNPAQEEARKFAAAAYGRQDPEPAVPRRRGRESSARHAPAQPHAVAAQRSEAPAAPTAPAARRATGSVSDHLRLVADAFVDGCLQAMELSANNFRHAILIGISLPDRAQSDQALRAAVDAHCAVLNAAELFPAAQQLRDAVVQFQDAALPLPAECTGSGAAALQRGLIVIAERRAVAGIGAVYELEHEATSETSGESPSARRARVTRPPNAAESAARPAPMPAAPPAPPEHPPLHTQPPRGTQLGQPVAGQLQAAVRLAMTRGLASAPADLLASLVTHFTGGPAVTGAVQSSLRRLLQLAGQQPRQAPRTYSGIFVPLIAAALNRAHPMIQRYERMLGPEWAAALRLVREHIAAHPTLVEGLDWSPAPGGNGAPYLAAEVQDRILQGADVSVELHVALFHLTGSWELRCSDEPSHVALLYAAADETRAMVLTEQRAAAARAERAARRHARNRRRAAEAAPGQLAAPARSPVLASVTIHGEPPPCEATRAAALALGRSAVEAENEAIVAAVAAETLSPSGGVDEVPTERDESVAAARRAALCALYDAPPAAHNSLQPTSEDDNGNS